ncbi:MAG: class I SAM-dependent methyltransferase [Parerythrobacter sp.]
MQTIKSNYLTAVRHLGDYQPLSRLRHSSGSAHAHGWRRWVASLFAIYDADEMIRLDLPWWNVAATIEAEKFLRARPNARAFEWGSGASTIWLARRSRQVFSVEHDADWHELVAKRVATLPQVTLQRHDLTNGDYVDAIHDVEGDFDLIIVDGRQRTACLQQAVQKLRPGGLILFDNSGRARYRQGITGCGLVERRFFGRTYCVPYPDHTSLLSRHG